MFECRVLGPTEVVANGIPVAVGGPLPRRLLTALVAAEGRVVTDDQLAEAIWEANPPVQVSSTLQVYVSRLRTALGPEGRALVERRGSGYRIPPEAMSTDTARFAQAVDEGTRLLTEDRAAGAFDILTDALRMWRGEPFADLVASPDAIRGRWTELREVAVEQRLAALLALGDAARAVAELEGAVLAEPYRERRWALLILGLYRCGRQGDALSALRRVRGLLADELGVDPGPELQELERGVLAQDPWLLLPQPGSTGRPLSSFHGRETELERLAALLVERRLVTLVGPAGVGKTRLAVEYLAGRQSWLVRLADVARAAVVPQAVADAVGLAEVAGEPRRALVRALASRRGLLVLDNCEHLAGAVAELVTDLLASCPNLLVLATSRMPLEVDGEVTVALGPLPTETGVVLLLDRVRAVRPDWTPTAGDLTDARQVCEALDGLPLALELAAARARLLSLGEIAERLDDRFAVLGPVPRSSLTPHATLREAVAWSVDLLSDTGRALLSCFWPFEGGFSLEAAEAVGPPGTELLDSLSSLVSQSMIMVDTTMHPTRYRMLDTIRAYCRAADPDPSTTRAAHAEWIRELAVRCSINLVGRQSNWAMRLLNREWPNLRAGITHDLEHQPAVALRTLGMLNWFWTRTGHIAESRWWLEEALRAAPEASTLDRARAMSALSNLAYYGGDLADGLRLIKETFAIIGEPADDDLEALRGRALYYLALGTLFTGDIDTARGAAEQAITVSQHVAMDWLPVGAHMALGAALSRQGEVRRGNELLIEAIHQSERLHLFWFTAWSELELAKSLLTNSAPTEAVTAAIRRSLIWFQHEADTAHTLVVAHVAAAHLLTNHPYEAARLRAAILHHAERLGLAPTSIVQSGLGPLDLDHSLTPAQRATAEAEGIQLTWSDLLALAAL